jgi:choline dehydrogenase
MPENLRYADHPDPARDHNWALPITVTGGRSEVLTRGRVVGGCAQVNQSGAVRGAVRDFEAWAALGLPAWGFDSVLPAYRRLESDLE